MQFINYFFASVISFSGLIIGILLVNIAPEEKRVFEKTFFLLKKSFLLFIFIFIIFYYYNSVFYLIIIIACLILLLIIEHKDYSLSKKSAISYAALAILFFLSSDNTNLFTIEASLVFMYGLPTASLMYNKKENNSFKIFLHNASFIVISNLLFIFTISHFLF